MTSKPDATGSVRTPPAATLQCCLNCQKPLPAKRRTANQRRYCDARCRRQACRERKRLRLVAALEQAIQIAKES